jgi:hypothetical protein
LERINDIPEWIKEISKDPVIKILVENSNLTKIQLETFLINLLTDEMTENKIKYDEKAKLRIKGKVSRGSFNRTLKQSQKNIISSIYTILLLGYLGIFDSPSLSQYIEISNKIKRYIDAYREIQLGSGKITQEDTKLLKIFHNELEKNLQELINHRKLSNRM